jgi:Uma2 family endonuclease
MAVQEKLYTAAEFWDIAQLPENENKRLELVAGVIYELPPSSRINTILAARLTRLIGNYVEERDLGYVTSSDGGYQLDERTVLIPDVGFIAKERVPDLSGTTFPGAPDLAVEDISPSETSRKVLDKAQLYLLAGTRLVWAVHPEEKVVDVYRLADDKSINVQPVRIDGVLDGGDVLPGFKLAVSEVFKGLGE